MVGQSSSHVSLRVQWGGVECRARARQETVIIGAELEQQRTAVERAIRCQSLIYNTNFVRSCFKLRMQWFELNLCVIARS